MPEQITLPPLVNQEILRNLGMADSTYLGNSEYYLSIALMKSISYLGEAKIIELYPKYPEVKIKLEQLNKKLVELKVWYDAIEDKRFEKIKEQDIKKIFFRTVANIINNRHILYELFYGVIVKNTTLQRQIIKNEAFKILEHSKYSTLKIDDKNKQVLQTEPNQETKPIENQPR